MKHSGSLPASTSKALPQQAMPTTTPAFFQASLDALTAHIAILDANGTIIATNEAWHRFAMRNGLQGATDTIGVNYLATCDGATGQCADEGALIAQGIRDVIAGKTESFELEYPCHGPHQQRWFLARVTRFLQLDLPDHPLRIVVAHENITARHIAEVSLRESEERYRAFVGNSSEAIWRAELEQPVAANAPTAEQIEHFYRYGYLAECNDAMARMYGFTSAADIVGTRLSDLIPRDDPANIAYLTAFVQSGHRLVDAESHEVDRDGHHKYFVNNLVAVPDENGLLWRAWGMQRDVTDEKRHEQERERLLEIAEQERAQAERERARAVEERQKAEAASRAKDQFLAVISHELRTPLTAVLGWASILRHQSVDDDTLSHALEIIERNVRAQAQIINDLLDVSRITSGKLSLNMQLIEPAPVVSAALETVAPAARAREIEVHSDLQTTGPIWGDAARLQQVVWNLLSNAVKFTPRGGKVAICLSEKDSHVVLTVSDSGPGVQHEFLPHAFERFRQADSSSTRVHGGLGLGLSIVRHLVEMHGGTVEVRNGINTDVTNKACVLPGATFTVRFPLPALTQLPPQDAAPPETALRPAPAHEEQTPVAPQALAGLSILVVEDEPTTREMVVLVLKRQGATIDEADSVASALQRFKEKRPDLIVSDIGMPEEDGFTLVRQIRALAPDLPCIALTAYAHADEKERALAAGFTKHLSKPIAPDALVAAIADLRT